MLFLFPALNLGIIEAKRAIMKSYQWLFGTNEVGEKMIVDKPFFIYRSIRKKGKYERENCKGFIEKKSEN